MYKNDLYSKLTILIKNIGIIITTSITALSTWIITDRKHKRDIDKEANNYTLYRT